MSDDKENKGKFTEKIIKERLNKTSNKNDINSRVKNPTTENANMVGGKNTLPKTKDGMGIDYNKIKKDGEKKQGKPFTERDGIKKPENKSTTTPKKTTPPKRVIPTNGINKLKTTASKNISAKTNEKPKIKGLSKFKAETPKTKPIEVLKNNTKKPSQKVNIKASNKISSKMRQVIKKTKPSQKVVKTVKSKPLSKGR